MSDCFACYIYRRVYGPKPMTMADVDWVMAGFERIEEVNKAERAAIVSKKRIKI